MLTLYLFGYVHHQHMFCFNQPRKHNEARLLCEQGMLPEYAMQCVSDLMGTVQHNLH